MQTILLAIRLLLSTVFGVAGLAKLADRTGSQQALINFGVPRTLAPALGVLLPLTELAISAALLPVTSAWIGAVGTFLLLLLFVLGIAVNLAHGRTPECHCFGQLHSAPASWSTLVRNGVLAIAAGFLVWQGQDNIGPSVITWMGSLTTTEIVGMVGVIGFGLLVAQGWLLLNLLWQNGRLLVRLEALEERIDAKSAAPEPTVNSATLGLPIGSQAPAFQLADLAGKKRTLGDFRAAAKSVLLIFSDPSCGPCNALMPDIARWQHNHNDQLTIVLISQGTPEATRAKSAKHRLTYVLLQNDSEISKSYQVNGTPSAVLVRADGTIGSPLAAGAPAIKSLVDQTVGIAIPTPIPAPVPAFPVAAHGRNGNGAGRAPVPILPSVPRIGDPAPSLKLPDLLGKSIDLTDFRGHLTLLLFWNPACGFCQRMLADLKVWEDTQPREAPYLVVVSTGTIEANQALGLCSPILLDQHGASGRAFGANGTPMAILIDEQGNIASEVAAGASAALALARDPHHIKLMHPL